MELKDLLKQSKINNIALIELIDYYNSYIKTCSQKRNIREWEDCCSYIKIDFIKDIKLGKFDKYINENVENMDYIIKRVLKNKSFDFWRNEKKYSVELNNLSSDASKLFDDFEDYVAIKIQLREGMDRLLTDNEKQIITELFFKDKKSSYVSKELNKSVSAVNKIKKNALKKLCKFIEEGSESYGR